MSRTSASTRARVRRRRYVSELTQCKKELDLVLDLLRTVYHCDYYLGLHCDFAEELVRRSAYHVRRQEASDEEQNDASWMDHLDKKIALLLDPAATAELGAIDKDAYVALLMQGNESRRRPVQCPGRGGQVSVPRAEPQRDLCQALQDA